MPKVIHQKGSGRVCRLLIMLTLFITLCMGVFLTIEQASADTAVYALNIKRVNGVWPPPPIAVNPVEVAGNFSVQSGSGSEKGYGVQILWGDGLYTTFRWDDPGNAFPYLTWSPNSPDAKTFTGTFNTNPGGGYPDLGHVYDSEGNYTLTVKLFHGEPPGSEGSGPVASSLDQRVLCPMLDASTVGPLYAHEGNLISYNITITNPSVTTTMYKMSIVDSLFGNITGDFSSSLAPLQSESRIYSYTVPSPSSDISSNITATYRDAGYELRTVNSTWIVNVLHPSVQITKSIPTYAHEGDTIDFNTTVINTGNCRLYNLTVVDTLMGTVTLDSLSSGQNYTFVFTYLIPSMPEINSTAVVNGSDILGRQVSNTVIKFTKVQYRLIVAADSSEATGGTFNTTYTKDGTTYIDAQQTTTWSEWIDSDTTVTISNPQGIVSGELGTRYVFDHFDPSESWVMTESTNVTLAYMTQYYLTVASPYGTTTGEGWYNASDTAYATLINGTVYISLGQTRAVFTGWSRDASGTELVSDPIMMDSRKTAIADWKTQYFVIVISDHDSPTGSDWIDQGGNFTASVTSPTEAIIGDNQWVSTGFSLDGGLPEVGTSYTFIDVQMAHNITFTWKHQFWIQVDSEHDSPTTSQWIDQSGNLTISVLSPADDDGNGTRYACTGYTLDSNLTVKDGSASYDFLDVQNAHIITFNWIAQYRVTFVSGHDSPIPAVGEYWYDNGDAVSASVTSPADDDRVGTRYRCVGWTGTGAIPTNGTDIALNFNVTAPSILTWDWIPQYYVIVISNHDSPTGEGWYDIGSNVSSSVASPVYEGADMRYVVTGFMGMGSAPTSGIGAQVSFRIETPSSVMWNWKTQYYITVISEHDTPTDSDWVDQGGSFTVSVTSPTEVLLNDNQWVSTGFSVDGGSPEVGTFYDFIDVHIAHNITFTWKQQFWIQVDSAHDSPTSSQWIDRGGNLAVSVLSPADDDGNGTRYRCAGYTLDNSTSVTDGSVNYDFLDVQSAHAVTFNWMIQYRAVIISNHGSPVPAAAEYWHDSGNSVSASVTSPADDDGVGTRYRCIGWIGTGSVPSIGASLTLTFNVTSPSTLTWDWIAQYYLIVISDHDSPSGQGWYDTGSNVSSSVASPVYAEVDMRYAVTEFMGMGSAPTRGVGNHVSFQISTPSSVMWSWKTQYLVMFNQSGLDSSVTQQVVTVDGLSKAYFSLPYFVWIDKDSRVSYLYETIVSSSIAGKRFVLDSVSGISSPINITESNTVIGYYKTQFYLTVTSAHDTPAPTSGWFDSETLVDASVASAFSDSVGVRYFCTGWNGTGSVPTSGAFPSVTFILRVASNLTWNWKTQYYLALSTNFGIVTPSDGWYDEGSSMSINAAAPTVVGAEGFRWYGWTGLGSGSYSGLNNPASITMNGPINATSYWRMVPSLSISISDETVAKCDRIVVYGTTLPVNSMVELEVTYTSPSGKQVTHTTATDETGQYIDVLYFDSTNTYGVFTQTGQWTVTVNRLEDVNHETVSSFATMGIKAADTNLFLLAWLAVVMTVGVLVTYLFIDKRVKGVKIRQICWRRATIILGLTGVVFGLVAMLPNWVSVQGAASINGQTYWVDFGLNPFRTGSVSVSGAAYAGAGVPSLISSAWSKVPKNPGPVVTLYMIPVGCALALVSLYKPKSRQEKKIKLLMLMLSGVFILAPIVSSVIFMAVQSSIVTGASTGYSLGLFVAMTGGLATLLSSAFAERESPIQTSIEETVRKPAAT